ncbi:MAG: hypothetical protein A2Y72_01025 [Chloroflexi bacterium RBG_13_53_26]|nr:MAG: hypothetical protein A2Y72_01025 [Chloroflexi bacterium RBG_13_53_26]
MKAVFLDRDGVINELVYHQDSGVIDSPFTPGQFRLLPKVGEAIRLLNQSGLKVIVVSNQPGIAKNHFTEETLAEIDEKMKQELKPHEASLDRVYYCYHHPEGQNPRYRVSCSCRKPKPGMLLQAAKDFDLDLASSFVVGDNLTDVKAGEVSGCRTILIGKKKCELCHLMDEDNSRPDAIVDGLLQAVHTILNWEGQHGNIH